MNTQLLKYRKTLRLYFVIKRFLIDMYNAWAIRSISAIFNHPAHGIIRKNVL